MPIGIGAAILAGSLGSAAIGAGASIFGASEQVSAEQKAIQAQQKMFGVAQNELQPFISGGQNNLSWYDYLTGTGNAPAGATGGPQSYNPLTAPLTAPFTAANLSSTPGYEFSLNQGLKGVNNSYAAEGLGSSGAALKGAASFATGTAQNTYNQQFQNYLAQNQQIMNALYQPVQTGAGAAGTLAGAAVGTGQGIASSTAGIGNAYAGGAAGVSNSVSGGLNSYLQYNLLQQLLSNQANGQAYNASISPNALSYNQNALATSGALAGGNTLSYGVPGFGSGYNAFTQG